MNTAFLLMAQYQTAVIPSEKVARDYFKLSTEKFQRKVLSGEIALPLVRMEGSQKSARGVHLTDLATYLDKQRDAALKVAGLSGEA
jgi:hypothetical protein